MNKDQYKYICDWQNKIFTDATPLSCAKHLKEEVQEMIDNFEAENLDLYEVADCFLLLFGVCNKLNLGYDSIVAIIYAKMQVNEKREWEKTDKGYMKHKDLQK